MKYCMILNAKILLLAVAVNGMPQVQYQVPFNMTTNQTAGELFQKLGFISPDKAIIPLIKYTLKLAKEAANLRKQIANLERENSLLKKRVETDSDDEIQSSINSDNAQSDSFILQSDSSSGCASTVPCETCCTCFGNFVYDPNIHGIITDACLWCFLNHGFCIGNCCELSG